MEHGALHRHCQTKRSKLYVNLVRGLHVWTGRSLAKIPLSEVVILIGKASHIRVQLADIGLTIQTSKCNDWRWQTD